MSQYLHRRHQSPTTRAAEGLPRRRWTTAELEQMVALGIIDQDERFELIGGEVVPMSPKGRRHEVVRDELTIRWTRAAPEHIRVSAEPQLNLTSEAYTNPDIVVRPASILMPDVRGGTALLVVEVADSSLAYDIESKAPLYASFGVREYWVVNARSLVTHVFYKPTGGAYELELAVGPSENLEPQLATELAIRMADLKLADE